ncbi:MAG: histidinol-phosphatase [Oscillospiraceae bacterium]|nr:histidinol-phosphatase [Oscillospiraceae bacterium]
MDYNFHTHTARCNHATGTDEEYVLRAISCGIKDMGFSDHMPLSFADGHESGYRVPIAQVGDYMASLSALREKYRGQINLHIGFEMEVYPSRFDEMVTLAKGYGAEYLLLGQHYIGEEWPDGFYPLMPSDDPAQLAEYTDCVVTGIESGLFTYVAHPDLFNYTGDDLDLYRQQALRICEASLVHDVPLEINVLGIRNQRTYPRADFWAVAGQVGCPVTFGLDAHTPHQAAYDEDSMAVAKELVQKFHLNYIDKPKLILLK